MNSRKIKVRRSAWPTRLGLHLIFIAIFTMVGGALRGFNLLLVLAGLLIGGVLIAWRHARWFSNSVHVDRVLFGDAFVGKPFRVSYRVHNLSRLLPLWMISIRDEIRLSDQAPSRAVCAVGHIPPGQTTTTEFECVVYSRGLYRLGPIVASSSFPFSLFSGKQRIFAEDNFCVFPRPLLLRTGWQDQLLTAPDLGTAPAGKLGAQEGDFFGLRPWQVGDHMRWIHHRTTARVGEPVVRQFERQLRFDACLLVDCFHEGEDFTGNAAENAISFAANILLQAGADFGSRMLVAVAGKHVVVSASGFAKHGKQEVLRSLAAAKIAETPDVKDAAKQLLNLGGAKRDLVVISSRSQPDAIGQAELAELNLTKSGQTLAEVFEPWIRRGALRWIDVSNADFQTWIVSNQISRAEAEEVES